MKENIAYCGLDCFECEARESTVNNDNELRKKIAEKWSELNKTEITPEMINCEGCRIDGKKTPFCESMCPIRQCAINKNADTCGCCEELETCKKIKMITATNKKALDTLRTYQKNIRTQEQGEE